MSVNPEKGPTSLNKITFTWPQLGQILSRHPDSDIKNQVSARKRESTMDKAHQAFLLVRSGRGGEIVGNPFATAKEHSGVRYKLGLTGLEGYYAGSKAISFTYAGKTESVGLTPEDIILELANLGADQIKTIIEGRKEGEYYYNDLKFALEHDNPTNEQLVEVKKMWNLIVTKLRSRMYDNPEFSRTLQEEMDYYRKYADMLDPRTEKEAKASAQQIYAEYKAEWDKKTSAEQAYIRDETRKRQYLRSIRTKDLEAFRAETYRLIGTKQGYFINPEIENTKHPQITETVILPDISGEYTETSVGMTDNQINGYELLVDTGRYGGSPLVRIDLLD